MKFSNTIQSFAAAGLLLLAAYGWAQDSSSSSQPAPNSVKNAYFGDLHVHTAYSLDAFSMGNRNDPRKAYQFGRGEEVVLPGGQKAKLRIPLDFMAVTDHDIWLGEVSLCNDPSSDAYKTKICDTLRQADKPQTAQGTRLIWRFAAESVKGQRDAEICGSTSAGPGTPCYERAASVWKQIQKNADDFYQPGKFTTFPGFEWTANLDRIGMLHRNVIFRNTKGLPDNIASAVELNNSPERLWAWLQNSCTGECQVVSIPHNTNFGWGVALDTKNSDGTPFTKEILADRAKSEPLIEIHQIKGNSECAPGLGTTDEQCNFEQLFKACKAGQTAFCAVARDYVRNALKSGLLVDEQFGINPFKYGFISDTDTHSSNPGSADEKGWTGGSGLGDATAAQRLKAAAVVNDDNFPIKPLAFNPGGLAGVWAEENTRESIFAALKRKETFATSGPRIEVRFFAGWDYPSDLNRHRDLLKVAYAKGVPMGADLPAAGSAKSPRFVLWAAEDPDGPPLQKLQIIKGWTKNGQAYEDVIDVTCSDGLSPDPKTHRCPDNGAQVDLSNCETSKDKGAAELSATWSDPAFDGSQRSFYYVRVIANPSCRWTTYDAIEAGQNPPSPVPSTVQERAWSSPIWYTAPSQSAGTGR